MQWQHIGALQAGIGTLTRETPASMMTMMVTELGGANGRRQLARYELFDEGVRTPELRPLIAKRPSGALRSAKILLDAAGLNPTDQQVGETVRLLNGLAYSNLTFTPERPGRDDSAGLIERMLTTVFG